MKIIHWLLYTVAFARLLKVGLIRREDAIVVIFW
jgi:hypothetical protein